MDLRSDPTEQRVIDAVSATGSSFSIIDCDPERADTAAFCEAYGFSLADSANTILVATKEAEPRVVACVVLATHRLDVNGIVRRRLEARKVSFAPADMTSELTGMVMGGVTPFGLPDSIPVWVDEVVLGRDRVVVGGGSRSMKVTCAPEVLTKLSQCEVVSGLALPVDG